MQILKILSTIEILFIKVGTKKLNPYTLIHINYKIFISRYLDLNLILLKPYFFLAARFPNTLRAQNFLLIPFQYI